MDKECIICGKRLEEKRDVCDSCNRVLKAKYPRNKLREVIKCHRKNARKLRKG